MYTCLYKQTTVAVVATYRYSYIHTSIHTSPSSSSSSSVVVVAVIPPLPSSPFCTSTATSTMPHASHLTPHSSLLTRKTRKARKTRGTKHKIPKSRKPRKARHQRKIYGAPSHLLTIRPLWGAHGSQSDPAFHCCRLRWTFERRRLTVPTPRISEATPSLPLLPCEELRLASPTSLFAFL